MLDNNPNNVEEGQCVILDKEFRNSSEVVIKKITPNQMFSTVHSKDKPDDVWSVMTDRLSPLKV